MLAPTIRALLAGAIVACAALVGTGCADEEAGTKAHAANNEQRQQEALADTVVNAHASDETGIDSSNVDELQQDWSFSTESLVTGMPVVDEGTVYVGDWSGRVYAVDAETGEQRWRTRVEQPRTKWPWHGIAGPLLLADGTLYGASVEGRAFALDPDSGELRWRTRITDQQHAGSLAEPAYHDGTLFLGLQSVEELLSRRQGFKPNFQGRVMALDASDGSTEWERPLVQPPSNGVPVWGGFAVDEQSGTLYTATGNNYTGDATDLSDAVIAMDIDSGEIKWSHQVFQDDVWTVAQPVGPDWDFGSPPQLYTANVAGEKRRVVGVGNKSGIFYTFDAQSGERLWASVIGYGAVGGGMRWAASIGDGTIFAASNNRFPDRNPKQFPIDVKAIDAATGGVIWSRPRVQPAVGTSSGFLSNDVYLMGSLDGTIQAYAADDGDTLATLQAPGAVGSSLVVEGDRLYAGIGVPPPFGGSGNNALVAWTPQPGATGSPSGEDESTTGTSTTEGETAPNQSSHETGGKQAQRPAALPDDANFRGTMNVAGRSEVEMQVASFYFDPTVLRGEAGQELTLQLHNTSQTAHTFTIPKQDVNTVLEPDERAEVKITFPQHGSHQFLCRFHRGLGMVGLLTVE